MFLIALVDTLGLPIAVVVVGDAAVVLEATEVPTQFSLVHGIEL